MSCLKRGTPSATSCYVCTMHHCRYFLAFQDKWTGWSVSTIAAGLAARKETVRSIGDKESAVTYSQLSLVVYLIIGFLQNSHSP